MRIVFFLLALAAAGYAGYLYTHKQTNYASYSEEQLVQFEGGYDNMIRTTRNDEQDASRVAQMHVQQELTQRLHIKLALGTAGVCVVLALVFTLLRGRDGSSHELAREPGPGPTAHEPGASAGMTREQAAALLGVQTHAPRAVIEAALHAQLAEREPSQLVGLDPTLKHNVLQQREELRQAGNVLLGRQELAFTPEPPRD